MDEYEVLKGTLITRYFSIYLENEETIVVADLHLGFEGVMHEEGFFMPRFQKREILKILEKIIKRYAPKKIVINGDFKHNFSRNLRQEWEEVNDVLDYLKEHTEVILIRGNHDNYLQTILAKKGLELHEKTEIGKLTIVHGHEDISWKDTLVIGHEHPSFRLRDTIGAIVRAPCFLVNSKVIVLPAFSPLAYGSDITNLEPLSPPLKSIDLPDLEVFAIDEKMGLLSFNRVKELI